MPVLPPEDPPTEIGLRDKKSRPLVLTPEVIRQQLALATDLPLDPGMRIYADVREEGSETPALRTARVLFRGPPGGPVFAFDTPSTRGAVLRLQPWMTAVPDLDDRATFLLLCDEAERRGIQVLACPEDMNVKRPRLLGSITEARQAFLVEDLTLLRRIQASLAWVLSAPPSPSREPMTTIDALYARLCDRLRADPRLLPPYRCEVELTDLGQYLLLDGRNGTVTCLADPGADCTIQTTSIVLLEIVADPKKAVPRFFSGKLKIGGNKKAALEVGQALAKAAGEPA